MTRNDNNYRRRQIRVDEYVAELLEREAALIPPDFEANAEILRQQAKYFRESGRTETVVVWNEQD
jgi:hypothetical protein